MLITNFDTSLWHLCHFSKKDIEQILIQKASQIMNCDITEKSQKENITKGRQFVIYRLIKYQSYSLRQAGEAVNLDHATASHAKKVIQNIIDTRDKKYYPLWLEFLKNK